MQEVNSAVIVENSVAKFGTRVYSDFVLAEEQAEKLVLPEKFAVACNQSVFTPAAGMMRIENVLDGNIFAAIRADVKGDRSIEFCQRYEDGTFSPKISVLQADLLFAAKNKFVPDGIPVPRMKTRLGKILEEVTLAYYGKVAGTEIYAPLDILEALAMTLHRLPVWSDKSVAWTPESLYLEILNMVNGKNTAPITPLGEHRSYMAFDLYQITAMAEHLGMKSHRELLKLLEEHRLLYLTESSQGYQSKIKVDGVCDWAYCIYRMEYIAERMRIEGRGDSWKSLT